MSTQITVPRYRLKYVATINDEALGENTDPDYEIRYIDISNVDSLGKIHELAVYRFADAPSRARRLVHQGDVIVSCVRTYLQAIAPIQEATGNLVVSTGFAVVRPRPEVFDTIFSKYALRDPAFLSEVEIRSVGVSYPAINASDLGDISIHLPPLQQQRAIANFLDREITQIDSLIVAKERLLGLLAEKRRAIITHTVTCGLDPNVTLRDSGVSWLGKIPAHWSQCHLKRVLASMDYGISSPVESSGEIAVIRMGDICEGEIDYSKVGFVNEVDNGLLLQPRDLLFNRTNSLDQIGKVAIFRGMPDYPASFASYLVRFRCKSNILPEFLNFLLNSDYPIAWGRAQALPAIGQVNLNPNRYGYLPIIVPPIREQKEIVQKISEYINKNGAVRIATENTLALLKERRAALIAAAVTGQIAIEGVT